MTVIWLVLAFALFMAAIGSVYALNRFTVRRYGCEPFSLPNAALMLVVNLLLLSAFSGVADGQSGLIQLAVNERATLVKLSVAAVLALWMVAVVARRSSVWIALYAVPLMAVGSIAILPSLLFRHLALAGDDAGDP
jgi:hypothetical protein